MRINDKFVTYHLGPGPHTFAEIGVHKGDNAYSVLTEIPIKQAWLIDPWSASSPAGYNDNTQADWDELCESVKKRYASYPNVTILRTTSEEGAKLVPNELDFVYIDADHSYEAVKLDLRCWFPKVRMGGIISGDDYTNLDARQAVTELVAAYQLSLRISPETTQWWAVKLPPPGTTWA